MTPNTYESPSAHLSDGARRNSRSKDKKPLTKRNAPKARVGDARPVNKKRISRPDGLNPKNYQRLEKVSNEELAWEFLRRNDDFQKLCKSLAGGDPKKTPEQIASAFNLVKFKHPREPYSMGGLRTPPLFTSAHIEHQARLSSADPKAHEFKLREGDVVFKLPLKAALGDKGVLKARAREVEAVLEKYLKKYIRVQSKDPKALRVKKPEDWIKLLRLLDAINAGKDTLDLMKAIFPKTVEEITRDGIPDAKKLKNKCRTKHRRAVQLAEEGYLKIAKWTGESGAKAS